MSWGSVEADGACILWAVQESMVESLVKYAGSAGILKGGGDSCIVWAFVKGMIFKPTDKTRE